MVPGCKEHNILLFDDYTTEHDINVCKADNTTNYDLALSYDFNTPTTMSVAGCPTGASCGFSANPIAFPNTTTLQFTNLNSASSGAHPLTVTATDGGSKVDTESLTLKLFDTPVSAPSLLSPANDSYAPSLAPSVSWSSLVNAQSYTVEIDDDPAFGSIDFTANVDGLTSATSGTLALESCYYWRVSPSNLCGNGPASSTFRFYTPGTQTTAVFSSVDVPKSIPLSPPPSYNLSELTIAGVGYINDVNVIDLNISHTYVGAVSVQLISPQGTTVTVMSQPDNNSACGNLNNIDISLDDEGSAAAWPCNPTGNGGTYQPSNPLSAFDGENADGTWTLVVRDPYDGAGSGSLNGWGLEFENFVNTGNHCPPGFTVGGNVTGLVGSGLVLQNNGGDDLAIAADGSFTFSTYLDDLDPFSVTVLTQPGSPNQTCSVTNGSGSISGNNVTNVTVTCVTDPDISFSGTNLSQDVCVNPGPTAITPVTLTTTAVGGYSNTVNLAFNPVLPTGITGGFSLNNFVPAAAPGTDSILNLSVDNTASAGLNTITVEASGTGAVTKSVDVSLNVIFPISTPTLSSPTEGSTGVAINTSFSWTAVSGASSYDIDIATDPAFSNIVSSANVGTNSYTPGASLSDSTVYYWRVRANDSCGSTDYAMAAFETVGGAGGATDTFCSAANLNLTIPDNDPNGVDNILNIATTGTITDINISVDISHTWVGDLIVGVTSPANTSVDVIDRPGYAGSGNGCSRDNIDTVLDDEAVNPVESECVNNPPNPAIGAGPFSPNNPLSAFDSEALNGNWTMNVSDNDNIIQGTLNQWCVIATYDTGATLLPADYGDLASSYGVAKHEGGGTARLGSNWTADNTFAQDGDDADDDGITASGNWEVGSLTANININSNAAGYVACWFDWNNDGTFAAGEKSVAQSIASGGVDINVSIPGSSTFGQNGDDFLETRCRFYNSEPVLATESPIGTATSGEVEDYRFGANQLTPITLSFTKALSLASGTSVEFSTTTETGVVGFNIYGLVNNSWKKLNNSVVGAKGINSLKPHSYNVSSTMKGVEQYQIEELKTDGTKAKYGPYLVNQTYGKVPQVTPIDWVQISNDSNTLQQSRQTLIAQSFDFIKLKVRSEGLQRVTYEDLLSAGVDWNGVAASDIAVSFENKAVARKASDSTFAPGSYIDFIGKPADSLYTDENVYLLKLDSSLAKAPVNNTSQVTVDPDAYYMSEASVTEDLKYSFASPANSPWYNTSMLVYQTTGNWSFPLALPNLLNNGVDAELEYSAWGGTAWDSFNPDHHLQVSINGNTVSDLYADGVKVLGDSVILSHSQIQGASSLNFIMPADTGADYDLVLLDYFRLKYPSEIVAVNDGLAFVPVVTNGVSADIIFQNGFEVGQSLGFVAKGFSVDDLFAYSTNGSELYEFPNAGITFDNGSYNLSLPFIENNKYYVGSNSNVSAPEIELGTASSIDLSQQYDYLVISHPDFIAGLAPLISYHQNNGLSVLVVNVEDVYALYSNFRKDARGIQSFIKDTYNSSNISAVMLVGSDSYDYKDNLGLGSISFIPTMYYQTDSLISYAPVDSLFADVDSDLIPDLAIGRLPVRTVSELQNMINKMFSYNSRAYTNTAIFASDRDSSFEQHSNAMLSSLPGSWSSTSAYIGDIELTDAQQALFNNINSGVSITNYFGHSGPSTWSFEHLFDNDDVLALNNAGKPTLVNQFGCWNNYFVLPTFNTMSHSFMSLENKGAVAVLGSSTLAESSHEAIFGNLLLPYMTTSGFTVGESILYSKQTMAANYPDYYDILLGWTLLGDPMMKVSN
jgi:subtilisin-like proprotein convertase family protein